MVILPRAKIDPPSLEFASHQRARGLVNRETTIAQSALPLLVLRGLYVMHETMVLGLVYVL